MRNFFTVFGGMGSLATESYVRLLNQRTPTTKDQDYLDYIVVNHATIPDRSTYILDHTAENPLPELVEDVKQQSSLNPEFFVLTCNSAHYFYDQMQAETDIPILHMPKLAVEEIKTLSPNAKRVGILGTPGTIKIGLYNHFIEKNGYELVKPTDQIIADTEDLIFKDIKQKGTVDPDRYHSLLQRMIEEQHCDIVVLGCTELSLAQEQAPDHDYPVADAQSILVDKTIERALALRKQLV
ncbi:aspartate/glutamate racemase family protein [Paucilactobacillus sp. N302-9]